MGAVRSPRTGENTSHIAESTDLKALTKSLPFFLQPVNWTESVYERLPYNTTEKYMHNLTALMEHRGIPQTPLRPWGAQAEHYTEAWVRRMHLVRSAEAARHFDAIGVGGLAARVYGDAATAEKQKVVTDWLSWLFVFDDQVDEGNVGQRADTWTGE